jgi:hypothetical protein
MGEIARSGATDPDTLRRAVIAGSVLASFCCEAFGLDRFRSLEAPEIAARTDDFRSLTRF